MTEERRQIIKRLENCKYKHKEFYKKHPDLLVELNSKIYALKNGNEYTIFYCINNVFNFHFWKEKKTVVGSLEKTKMF